jgi:hypothetical protein
VRERPDLPRALLLGLLASGLVALAAGLLRSILDVSTGLLVLAVAGGWAVGAAVRRGAWGGLAHRASTAPEALGLTLGAVGWVAGFVLAWVVALAILPGSERSLADRLTTTPLLDWLAPQLGLADVLALVLAAVFGWYGARSAATAPAQGD